MGTLLWLVIGLLGGFALGLVVGWYLCRARSTRAVATHEPAETPLDVGHVADPMDTAFNDELASTTARIADLERDLDAARIRAAELDADLAATLSREDALAKRLHKSARRSSALAADLTAVERPAAGLERPG